MVRRRHQNKTKGWLIKKYWSAAGKHVFSFVHKYKKKTRILKVIRVCSIGIKRHIKIKAEANLYLPEYSNYYWRRRNVKEARLLGALSHRQYQALIASRQNSRVVPQGQPIEMLELYDGKLSRTVLRRESGSNARDLSGVYYQDTICKHLF